MKVQISCLTCPWFEPDGVTPQPGQAKTGHCLINPPQASLTNIPAGQNLKGDLIMKSMVQGIVPPTAETGRCRFHPHAQQFYQKQGTLIDGTASTELRQ